MNETNPSTQKKPRAKPEGQRGHVVIDPQGNEWLVSIVEVRVANQSDLNRALDGLPPRGEVVKKVAAS